MRHRYAALLVLFAACASGDDASKVPTHLVKAETLTRSVTAEGNLRAVESTAIMPPRVPGLFDSMKLAWIADDGIRVKEGDVVIRFDPTALSERLKDNQSNHASASAQLAKERIVGRSAAARRDASADLAQKELEKTQRFREKDTEIYSRNQIIEAQVDEGLSLARQKHAEAAKQIERGLSQSKAALAQVSRRQAALEMERASTGLKSLEVTAPHDGLLVLKRNWRGEKPRVGETVWPGQKLAEIPELSKMEAEIFVLEVDGGGLAKGTVAEVVIESLPAKKFAGTVKHVDDIAKERLRGVPVQYFAATVELETTVPEIMKPGQRVRARLSLEDEAGLVVPRSSVFVVDGVESVFVKKASGFEPVAVELGASTAARVLISGDVSAGDEVAMVDPREASKNQSANGSGAGSQ